MCCKTAREEWFGEELKTGNTRKQSSWRESNRMQYKDHMQKNIKGSAQRPLN